jgi:hypothetical protein
MGAGMRVWARTGGLPGGGNTGLHLEGSGGKDIGKRRETYFHEWGVVDSARAETWSWGELTCRDIEASVGCGWGGEQEGRPAGL